MTMPKSTNMKKNDAKISPMKACSSSQRKVSPFYSERRLAGCTDVIAWQAQWLFIKSRTNLVQMQVAHLGDCVVHGYSLNTSKTHLLHGGCRQHNSKLGE